MLLLSKQRQFSFHLFSKYPIGRDLYFSRFHFHSSTKLTNQRGNNEIKSKATYQNKRKEYQSKKNLLLGFGLGACLIGIGSYPFFLRKYYREQDKSLMNADNPLAGSQILRGQYMNTGSKDVGRDYDWDKETGRWTGRKERS